jgi:hypothetical protein
MAGCIARVHLFVNELESKHVKIQDNRRHKQSPIRVAVAVFLFLQPIPALSILVYTPGFFSDLWMLLPAFVAAYLHGPRAESQNGEQFFNMHIHIQFE